MNSYSFPIYSFQETRDLDSESVCRGFQEIQLMGQAALSSLHRLIHSGIESRIKIGGSVYILCGTGNNGGDGLALAYHLLSWKEDFFSGKNLKIFKSGSSRTEAARHYENILKDLDLPIHDIQKFSESHLSKNDTILESILGTGQRPGLKKEIMEIIELLAKIRKKKAHPVLISLDIPAGVSESESIYTDETLHPAIPDEIHSYGVDKICLNVHPEICYYSKKHILPIGFYPEPRKLNHYGYTDHSDFTQFRRPALFHKYTAGYGMILGGSAGMEGALSLASRTFFAAGGGILKCAVPCESSRSILLKTDPGSMFHTIEEIGNLKMPFAFAAGPGLSEEDVKTHSGVIFDFFDHLSNEASLPWIILDAYCSSLVKSPDYPAALLPKTLITPHTGEWIRMGGKKISSTESLFEEGRRADSLKCHVLVKDTFSALFTRENGRFCTYLKCMPSGSAGVAGSGDVLTGIFAALMSRKKNICKSISEITSSALGLHLHSAKSQTNPSADQFPESIRNTIKSSSEN